MNSGKYVFAQIMSFISPTTFNTITDRYFGNYKVKDFTVWKQFLFMAYGQLTYKESLSITMLCLKSKQKSLYHLGLGKLVSLSSITRANESRSYKIFEDLAMHLINEAKELYKDENLLSIDVKGNVYAIDASTFDMCLSKYYWAVFRSTKAGVKLHTQIDLKTSIPEFILITNATIHDVNALDYISYEPNSFYIVDKGYVDFTRLYNLNLRGAFFVTRSKDNMSFKRVYSLNKSETKNVIFDQVIRLTGVFTSKYYPEKIRLIKYKDEVHNITYTFITNNFEMSANDIATLYKSRWDVELFFKWIKQHLRIKKFWGESENAVKTQIWIAIIIYVLGAIIKKKLKIENSLYEILQIFSANIFDKTPIKELFVDFKMQNNEQLESNQLIMNL